MSKPNLRLVTPSTDFGAVPAAKPLRKRPNAEFRSRDYLTEAEVERLIEAAKSNRHSHRDATMILDVPAWPARCRVTRLRWDAIDLDRAELHVARVKNGKPATHPLTGRQLRALRRFKCEQQPPSAWPVAMQYHFGNFIYFFVLCRARRWPIPGALSSR
jgi:integrase